MRSAKASQRSTSSQGWTAASCGTESSTHDPAATTMTTTVTAIGCSVRVDTKRPTAASAASPAAT